jgi:multicomponent K+:H+ antiporter subunit G
MNATVPLWIEALVGALLVASGIASIVAAVGLVRLKSFFMRMHPPALASTIGVWAVALASIVWFSVLESRPVLHAWVFPILMAITVPVTTALLARAALFRKRQAGVDVPPPLSSS